MSADQIPESLIVDVPDRKPRLIGWMKRRPIAAAVSFLGLVFVLDLAMLPWGALKALEQSNPGVTAFQQAYMEQERGRRGTISKRWLPIGRISEDLIAAVIVAEDGMFWSHDGFDWFEMRESLLRNLKEHRAARGASTITQQLIKNVFLSPSKNPLRKYHELVLTWYAERILTKRRILELYLNEIEWGRGLYGAEASAQYYFGVSASELNRDQSAHLAAVIPNPRRFSPTSGSRAVERRTLVILQRLLSRDKVRGRVEVPLPDSSAEAGAFPAIEDGTVDSAGVEPHVPPDSTNQRP